MLRGLSIASSAGNLKNRSPETSIFVARDARRARVACKPSIGRIVHFLAADSTTPEAALVIAVWSDTCVNLQVCNSGGTWRTETSVLLSDGDESRSRWAWPART